MTATQSRTCGQRVTNGTRSYACNRRAGQDGICGYHRKMLAPSPTYTCTACWRIVRRGTDGALCVEHADQPPDPRYQH